jgi:protease I
LIESGKEVLMKKIAVLIEDHYQVLEAWYPYLRLREEGIETVFVGTGKDGYISKEGYPAPQDLTITQAKPGEFDGVVIPGGYAPDILRRHKSVNTFCAIKDDCVNAGATFIDKEVVVDGNLITSRNPYDLPAFCREIIKFLKK